MHSLRESLDPRTNLLVRRAAVLGAGRLGSQIAALFANNGIPCDLLGLSSSGRRRSLQAEKARESLLSADPPPLANAEALELVRAGNVADDLSRLEEADWVIEAAPEKLHVKRQLWSEVAPYLRRSIINSTTTAAIPVAFIAGALPGNPGERFLGTQFFSPPRYLKLVEVIPHEGTSPAALADTRRVAERVLGKSIIVACDSPGFTVNRVGCYSFIATLRAMEEFGLSIEDVDEITGAPMGRPRSATFRSLDLIGLDVFTSVCDSIRTIVQAPRQYRDFEVPYYIRSMMARGWRGKATGWGFYKWVREYDGDDSDMVLSLDIMRYRQRRQSLVSELDDVRSEKDPGERIRKLVEADHKAGRFAWRVLSQVMAYAAWMVGEATDNVASIDRAMHYVFGWALGPFEIWSELGIAGTASRMQGDGLKLPQWVEEMIESGGGFYERAKAATA